MLRTAALIALSSVLGLAGCNEVSRVSRVNSAPTVVLVSPHEGALHRQGEGDIDLIAEVSDSYDPATDLTVTWSIDAGAPLSSPPNQDGIASTSLSPATLSVGQHEAIVLVTDSDGLTATAGVRFLVGGPFGSPDVTITAPQDGDVFLPGQSITFRGEAEDATTPADDLIFVWSSSIDGVLPGAVSSEGQSLLLAEAMSFGEHLISLTVTDADGETGADFITVRVNDDEVIAAPGDLVFSEFMVNPQVVPDEVGEWVELYNTSGSPIDVAGYSFHDDDYDSWILDGPLVVPAHGYLVLCADMDPAVNGGVACDGWFLRDPIGGGLALANSPDELVLSRPDGLEIDWVHYESDWFEAGAASGVKPSQLEGGANDYAEAWCVQTTVIMSGGEPGTPGIENDSCD